MHFFRKFKLIHTTMTVSLFYATDYNFDKTVFLITKFLFWLQWDRKERISIIYVFFLIITFMTKYPAYDELYQNSFLFLFFYKILINQSYHLRDHGFFVKAS